MFSQTYTKFPETFYVTAVQVATIWTNPESARDIDRQALIIPTNMENWLENLPFDKRLALCDENRVQTQTLFGEAVLVTEIVGDWAKIVIPSQPSKKDERGYPGWVPLKQLKQVQKKDWVKKETAAITQKYAWLETEAGEKVMKLSYMTCLPVIQIGEQRVEVETPDGSGFFSKDAVTIFPSEKGSNANDGNTIIEVGKQYIGLDYLWGGMSSFGYDCSGFAYAMHKANGYRISRDASDQAEHGLMVDFEELMPGDLLFFAYDEGEGAIHHVGFYYGDGKMLHSPQTGKGIEITSLKGTKFERELCIARRYWKAGGV